MGMLAFLSFYMELIMGTDCCKRCCQSGLVAVQVIGILIMMFMTDLTGGEAGTFLTENVPIMLRIFRLKCYRVTSGLQDKKVRGINML